MSTSKNYQNQQSFVPYRPNSPKMTTHTPTSLNSNQNQTYTGMQQRAKQNSHVEGENFATMKHENNLLKE